MKSLSMGLLLAWAAIVTAQSQAEKDLVNQLEKGPHRVKALERALATADELSPSALRAGMVVAMDEKRFGDSVFLLYAGIFRANFDLECFPPDGLDVLGPYIVNSATTQILVPALTRFAMHDPATFEKAIHKLKKWNPMVRKDYHPGYKHKPRTSEKAATQATQESRANIIGILSDGAKLLSNREYFAAFKVNQAFHHAPEEKRPSKKENETATNTMKRIEAEMRIKNSLVE